MKHCYSSLMMLAAVFFTGVKTGYAGNEDRIGQAGSTELLINPFARSSGWAGANTSMVRGLEAQFLNVAGTAFTKKTEVVFSHTNWLGGAGIGINAFGITQGVGKDKTGTIGLSVMSMNFGDLPITTVDQPEGEIGTFAPTFTNIGLSYAKEFSNSIYGGIVLRTISQSISDVRSSGVCLDAGVQYIAGKKENIRFGISLRNVGPRMKFNGDGLSFKGTVAATGSTMTVEQRNEAFELPSTLNIGGAYIFDIAEKHKLNVALNFCSNSFSRDQFQGGAEYSFNKIFMVRAGYMLEVNGGAAATASTGYTTEGRSSALTGPTAGFTVEAPLNKKGTTFALDYSYRTTNPFAGVHSIGARINL